MLMVDGPGALNPLMALVGDVDNVSCLGLDVGIVVMPSTTPTALDAPASGLPSFCPTSVGRLLCRRLFQPRSEHRPSVIVSPTRSAHSEKGTFGPAAAASGGRQCRLSPRGACGRLWHIWCPKLRRSGRCR